MHFHPKDLHPRHNHYHKDMKCTSWLNHQYDYLCKLVSGEQDLPRTLQVQKPGPLRTRLLPTPTATQHHYHHHQHSIAPSKSKKPALQDQDPGLLPISSAQQHLFHHQNYHHQQCDNHGRIITSKNITRSTHLINHHGHVITIKKHRFECLGV